MKPWKITSLYYGEITGAKSFITPGIDSDVTIASPYIGFLLQNGEENILVDNGIHESNIVDGKAWGGLPAKGGNRYVLDALAKEGLKPSDIHKVLYTHLHNDHAGGALLFKDTPSYFQLDEYKNLQNQLPSQKIRSDYDPRTPGDVAQLSDVYLIDGDFFMPNGLELYKTPGHTLGSMVIVVPTEKGRYVITGDMPHYSYSLFPLLDEMQLLDGSRTAITPMPQYLPFMFNTVIYDHWAAFASFNRIKALAEKFEPEYFLTGHDPWVIVRHTFG
ncbi:MAG: N-acyl homoserine lactonase family protein [Ruminococcaceae bacterium]|nr:N-acyl homoserine lactonase family protein [Oscillospiraceae bacterium]